MSDPNENLLYVAKETLAFLLDRSVSVTRRRTIIAELRSAISDIDVDAPENEFVADDGQFGLGA